MIISSIFDYKKINLKFFFDSLLKIIGQIIQSNRLSVCKHGDALFIERPIIIVSEDSV